MRPWTVSPPLHAPPSSIPCSTCLLLSSLSARVLRVSLLALFWGKGGLEELVVEEEEEEEQEEQARHRRALL